MKIWYFPVAIMCGLFAAFLLYAGGAPDWSQGTASFLVSGFATYVLIRFCGR